MVYIGTNPLSGSGLKTPSREGDEFTSTVFRLQMLTPEWSGPLGPDSDQAADVTMGPGSAFLMLCSNRQPRSAVQARPQTRRAELDWKRLDGRGAVWHS